MNPLDLRWQMLRDRWPLRVKNSSGAVIPPFSVVLITSVTASNNEMLYTVRQPNAASTDFNWNGYLVTGPLSIGAGASDEGLATDLAQPNYVRYDTGTPAIKEVWGPKHGQFTLSKGYYGFEIQGGNTTASGQSVTVARWTGTEAVLGKTDSAIAGSASGTVSVWAGTGGSESDTTMNITSVYNRGTNTNSGTWVFVVRNGGNPYFIAPPGTSSADGEFHRGTTDSSISKGGSGTVSRYTDGTTTDSTINDTVNNDFANVGSGKKVAYIRSGGNFYMIAAEC